MAKVYIPENELQHWKYIKREKVNGKWRYYYDDTALKKAEAKNRIAVSEYGQATADRHSAGKKVNAVKIGGHTHIAVDSNYLKYEHLKREEQRAKSRMRSASRQLRRTKVSAVSEKLIFNGSRAVSRLIQRLTGKLR